MDKLLPKMISSPFIIRFDKTPKSLEVKSLADVRTIFQRKPKTVKFNISFIDDNENDFWEKSLNHLLSDCGCETGLRYLIIFIPLVLLISFLNFDSIKFLHQIILFLCSNFLIALVGKIIGIHIRNKKIKILIQKFVNKKFQSFNN